MHLFCRRDCRSIKSVHARDTQLKHLLQNWYLFLYKCVNAMVSIKEKVTVNQPKGTLVPTIAKL